MGHITSIVIHGKIKSKERPDLLRQIARQLSDDETAWRVYRVGRLKDLTAYLVVTSDRIFTLSHKSEVILSIALEEISDVQIGSSDMVTVVLADGRTVKVASLLDSDSDVLADLLGTVHHCRTNRLEVSSDGQWQRVNGEWIPVLGSRAWRRKRNRSTVSDLRGAGKKWRLALDGERLAYVSLVGTDDWEDYVSTSFAAMELEATTDIEEHSESIDNRLKAIDERVARLESVLVQIRDLLADDQTPR